ncbi:hypothetical protein B0H10DRAFT_965524 [Mycena sp. CBHHK59/15]|nr:hypothetical protein B0H10DRAFT_965524 [Mycena sp. CBHHK59/15]
MSTSTSTYRRSKSLIERRTYHDRGDCTGRPGSDAGCAWRTHYLCGTHVYRGPGDVHPPVAAPPTCVLALRRAFLLCDTRTGFVAAPLRPCHFGHPRIVLYDHRTRRQNHRQVRKDEGDAGLGLGRACCDPRRQGKHDCYRRGDIHREAGRDVLGIPLDVVDIPLVSHVSLRVGVGGLRRRRVRIRVAQTKRCPGDVRPRVFCGDCRGLGVGARRGEFWRFPRSLIMSSTYNFELNQTNVPM